MTADPMRLAVDAMGGDLGSDEVVRGVISAAQELAGTVRFVVVGDETAIAAELARHRNVPPGIEIRHASQTIEMCDKPREVYRRKPDASVVVSARLVRDGEADAFVSIGNTGAAMASAVFMLRPIQGIDRPAIALPIPSLAGPVILLDAGATVDCSPRQLLEFGLMGSVYAREVLGKASPTIGLLSNGEEPSKGNEVTRQAHVLMAAELPGFSGNVEGTDVFRGKCDVVVCDGFSGNILLKTGEGVAEMVIKLVGEELRRFWWMRAALLPLRRGIRDLRARIDYRSFGGAPLLGVNGVCIVGHGKSDVDAIVSAIKVARRATAASLSGVIAKEIAELRNTESGEGEAP
jgi:phosphate acyltransferase